MIIPSTDLTGSGRDGFNYFILKTASCLFRNSISSFTKIKISKACTYVKKNDFHKRSINKAKETTGFYSAASSSPLNMRSSSLIRHFFGIEDGVCCSCSFSDSSLSIDFRFRSFLATSLFSHIVPLISPCVCLFFLTTREQKELETYGFHK